MSDADAFPVPVPAEVGHPCGDCDYVAETAFALGRHRFQKHGIRSSKRAKGKGERRRAVPVAAIGAAKPPTAKQLVSEVETSLAEAATKGGAMLLPIMPIPGEYLVRTGDEMAGAVARIAMRNPKLLAALSKSSDVMDYLTLGTWTAGLIIAVGVNFGRIPFDGTLSRQWGIDEIAREYGADERVADDVGATGPGTPAVVGGLSNPP